MFERGKASALLGTVWLAAAEPVKVITVKRVQLVYAAACQFKSRDEFHCFLRLLEAPITGAFLAPDTDHRRRKTRMVGGRSATGEETLNETLAEFEVPNPRVSGGTLVPPDKDVLCESANQDGQSASERYLEMPENVPSILHKRITKAGRSGFPLAF